MKVVIIDYGMGNLGSVRRAFEQMGADSLIAEDPAELADADRIILPGVGSFADGMRHLNERGWTPVIKERVDQGTPFLGICLGMQLLATTGVEGGVHAGLGLVPGTIAHLEGMGCKERIPHVGWNDIEVVRPEGNNAAAIFDGIESGTDYYFVHSFAYQTERAEDVLARVAYGIPVTAAVGRGHVAGTQFHPEKSSRAGFRILKNFLEGALC